MRFYGTLHPLGTSFRQPQRLASAEALPEIAPGAFAAWAHAEDHREVLQGAPGDDCLTPDGRRGHVVETSDGGYPVLVCQGI